MKTSLQRLYQKQITNAKELSDWAISYGSDIVFRYCSKTAYEAVEEELNLKFDTARPKRVKETRQYHGYIPINNNNEIKLQLQRCPASDKYDIQKFTAKN